MTPTDEALTIVRAGLRDVRIALGETTAGAEDHSARHGKEATR